MIYLSLNNTIFLSRTREANGHLFMLCLCEKSPLYLPKLEQDKSHARIRCRQEKLICINQMYMNLSTKEVLKQLVLTTLDSKWFPQGLRVWERSVSSYSFQTIDRRGTHGGADVAEQPWIFNMKKAWRKSAVFLRILILGEEEKVQLHPISREEYSRDNLIR